MVKLGEIKMATNTSLEERIAAVEAAITELQKQVANPQSTSASRIRAITQKPDQSGGIHSIIKAWCKKFYADKKLDGSI
jgi:hypothetical protein